MKLSRLDCKIIKYLDQEQRGVSFTWLMSVTGASVNAIAISVVSLEAAGLISSGNGEWPRYQLVEDVPQGRKPGRVRETSASRGAGVKLWLGSLLY